MNFTLILQAIVAALQFPGQVLALANLLRKTPTEKHAEIMKAASDEAAKFEQTGRPTWE